VTDSGFLFGAVLAGLLVGFVWRALGILSRL
jgi:hypothetical protein